MDQFERRCIVFRVLILCWQHEPWIFFWGEESEFPSKTHILLGVFTNFHLQLSPRNHTGGTFGLFRCRHNQRLVCRSASRSGLPRFVPWTGRCTYMAMQFSEWTAINYIDGTICRTQEFVKWLDLHKEFPSQVCWFSGSHVSGGVYSKHPVQISLFGGHYHSLHT